MVKVQLSCIRIALGLLLASALLSQSPLAGAADDPASSLSSEGSVISIAAGSGHTCAVVQKQNGDKIVECWGDNTSGELGNGNNTNSALPVTVISLPTNVIQVSASQGNTCALTADGKVYCWGLLRWGYGGAMNTPQLMSGMPSDTAEIELADLHLCLRTSGGAAKCAGNNLSGQLGNNSHSYSATPVDVTGLGSGVTSIATGYLHTCALASNGAVKCWGRNTEGQLGDNTFTDSPVPVGVVGLSSGIIAIAAGGWHTCALTSAGKVKCWGSNDEGELGGDSTDTSLGAPIDVRRLTVPATALSAGERHTCAITAANAVRCWGYNYGWMIGFTGLTSGATAIESGAFHFCAVAPINSGENSLRCVGKNGSGQLGDGTQTDSYYSSVEVQGLIPRTTSFISGHILQADGSPAVGVTVSAGSGLTAQTQPDGSFLFSSLPGGAYPLTPSKSGCTFAPTTRPVNVPPDGTGKDFTATCAPTPLQSATVLALGNQFTCALTTNGGVKCWGSNDSAQLGNGTRSLRSSPTDVSGLDGGVTGLASGFGHTCAITLNGVKCWGANGDYQLGDGTDDSHTLPVQVSGLESEVTALATGLGHTCALLSNGSVKCWGRNSERELGDGSVMLSNFRVDPGDVIGLSGVQAIAAGSMHTCALMLNGGVKCWGFNGFSQLGNGSTTNSSTPVDVSGFSGAAGQPKVIGLAADGNSTCALTQDHSVTCWGYGYGTGFGGNDVQGLDDSPVTAIGGGNDNYCARTESGSLRCWDSWTGDPGRPHQASVIPGLDQKVTGFDVGFDHVCGLTSDGGLKCQGDNTRGQLGNGRLSIPLSPLESTATKDYTDVTAYNHTCALTPGGGLECWGGNNFYGLLGNGTALNSTLPGPVSGLQSGLTDAVAGGEHTCALTTGGGVKCWGANNKGQVGAGTDEYAYYAPAYVSGLRSGVIAIAAGVEHTCAVLSNGGVKCWGSDQSGQLGDGGSNTNSNIPVNVQGLSGAASQPEVTAIAAEAYHTCALTSTGAVLCWGDNTAGQLGDGTDSNTRPSPVQVSGLTGGAGDPPVSALAVGGQHSCAITSTGMKCWGSNDAGQLGVGTTNNHSTPMDVIGLGAGLLKASAGNAHTCAVTSGGALKCWGKNDFGQLGNRSVANSTTPQAVSGLASGVTALAAGYAHTCAVSDGAILRCWGSNSWGQIGNGETNVVPYALDVIPLPPPSTYSLSGAITQAGGTPVEGVEVSVSGAQAYTKSDGGYTINGLSSGSYTLLPHKSGCTFSPVQRVVSVPPSASGLNFTAECAAPLENITGVEAGDSHTCALTTSGGVLCWGYNGYGNLGDGTNEDSAIPKNVVGLGSGVKGLALGNTFSCALTTSAGVLCWGRFIGASVINRFTPFSISGLESGVKAISAGRTHLCALTTTGGVKCLGSNISGQLGDGTFTASDDPVNVVGLTGGVTAIDAGGDHTCALTSAGALECWGNNAAGQLGNGGNNNQNTPVPVTGLSGGSGQPTATAIATGAFNTCALVDGAARCWGMNYEGQLGNGLGTNSNVPVEVSGLESGVTGIRVGGGFACALLTGGGVNCWGDNTHGALGEGTSGSGRWAPWPVSGLSGVVTGFSAGGNINSMSPSATSWGHVCAVTALGKVFCWGTNSFGQLGNRSTSDSPVPVYVVEALVTQEQCIYLPLIER